MKSTELIKQAKSAAVEFCAGRYGHGDILNLVRTFNNPVEAALFGMEFVSYLPDSADKSIRHVLSAALDK